MIKRRECHGKKNNVKEHSVIIIILNCYAGNYLSNFNLLKKSFFLYFVFETMVITKINEKLLLGGQANKKTEDKDGSGKQKKMMRKSTILWMCNTAPAESVTQRKTVVCMCV